MPFCPCCVVSGARKKMMLRFHSWRLLKRRTDSGTKTCVVISVRSTAAWLYILQKWMLEQITMAADYGLELRDGIEGRNKDSEDSPEVSINAIQAMLEKAYLLGKADGMKKAQ